MEIKSKSNLLNMKQKQLSKLSNDETIVIKPADKGGAVVILSTSHYQSLIMEHLSDGNTSKKGFCTDNKIQSKLLRFLRQYKMCFTEPEWKFMTQTYLSQKSYLVFILLLQSFSTNRSISVFLFFINYFTKASIKQFGYRFCYFWPFKIQVSE